MPEEVLQMPTAVLDKHEARFLKPTAVATYPEAVLQIPTAVEPHPTVVQDEMVPVITPVETVRVAPVALLRIPRATDALPLAPPVKF